MVSKTSGSSNMRSYSRASSYSSSQSRYDTTPKYSGSSSSYGASSSSSSSSSYQKGGYGSSSSYTPSYTPSSTPRSSTPSYSSNYTSNYTSSYSRPTKRVSTSVDRELGSRYYKQSEDYFRNVYPDYFNELEPTASTRRSRISYSVDRDLDHYGAYNDLSLDDDLGYSSAYRSRSRSATRAGTPSSRSGSLDRSSSRHRSFSSYSSYPDYGDDDLDYNLVYTPRDRLRRASSVTPYLGTDYEPGVSATRYSRESSVTRYVNENNQPIYTVGKPRARAASLSRYENVEREYMPASHRRLVTYQDRPDPAHYRPTPRSDTGPQDEISVRLLPSGEKAVCVTRTQQKASGDKQLANQLVERIIQKTNFLEQNISTLEDFVRRHRHLFPEETTIYQKILFFQLDEQQLLQIGEKLDAEVYGVRVKEKLVVPHGCDITDVLNKYCGSSGPVEVEYSGAPRGRPGYTLDKGVQPGYRDIHFYSHPKIHRKREVDSDLDLEYRRIYEKARKHAEVDMELRRARSTTPTYRDYAKRYRRSEDFNYPLPSVPRYVNVGLDYDSLYEPRSQRSSDIGSEHDSVYTKSSVPSSRRRKRPDAGPNFTSKLQSRRCFEGATVRFNCSVSGTPMPDIAWFKGNKPITDCDRLSLANNYGLLSLEITKVEPSDAGVYSVKATNPDGEATTSASLDVEDMEPESADGTRKPYFVADAQNTFAEVGQKASLEVQASGRPTPTFKWQKDNNNLEEGDRICIFSDESGNAKLVVKDIQHGDAGLYFCIAENTVGKAKCAATLRVVDHGQLKAEREKRRSASRESTPQRRRSASTEASDATPSQKAPRTKGVKPWFEQSPPSEMDVHLGDPLIIKCIVDGNPKPKVLWSKGVRDLNYSKRTRIVVDGNSHTMEITSTIQTDPGQYVVVAENSAGRAQTSCWVNMLPRREEERKPREIKRTRIEYPEIEYEVTKETEEDKMAPRFTQKLPVTKQVSPGDNLELACTVKEAPHPEHISDVKVEKKVKGEFKIREVTMKEGPDGKFHEVEEEPKEEKAPEPAEEVPAEKEKAPEPAEEKPAEEEKAPEPAEEKPVEEEKAPEPAEEKPVEEEKAPEPAEEAPAEEEKAPEPAEEAPAKEEVTVEVKEQTAEVSESEQTIQITAAEETTEEHTLQLSATTETATEETSESAAFSFETAPAVPQKEEEEVAMSFAIQAESTAAEVTDTSESVTLEASETLVITKEEAPEPEKEKPEEKAPEPAKEAPAEEEKAPEPAEEKPVEEEKKKKKKKPKDVPSAEETPTEAEKPSEAPKKKKKKPTAAVVSGEETPSEAEKEVTKKKKKKPVIESADETPSEAEKAPEVAKKKKKKAKDSDSTEETPTETKPEKVEKKKKKKPEVKVSGDETSEPEKTPKVSKKKKKDKESDSTEETPTEEAKVEVSKKKPKKKDKPSKVSSEEEVEKAPEPAPVVEEKAPEPVEEPVEEEKAPEPAKKAPVEEEKAPEPVEEPVEEAKAPEPKEAPAEKDKAPESSEESSAEEEEAPEPAKEAPAPETEEAVIVQTEAKEQVTIEVTDVSEEIQEGAFTVQAAEVSESEQTIQISTVEETTEEQTEEHTVQLPAATVTSTEETSESVAFSFETAPAVPQKEEEEVAMSFAIQAESTPAEVTETSESVTLEASETLVITREEAPEAKKEKPESEESSSEEESSESESEPEDKEKKPEGTRPEFVSILEGQTVEVQGTLKLRVQINAKPEPDVKWSKDGQDIVDGGRFEMFVEDNAFNLELSDVTQADSGTYTCTAVNKFGSMTCSCTIIVVEKGVASAAPTFDSQIAPVIATEGAEARFEIRISGGADLNIIWLRNGEELTASDRIKISQEGNLYILIISSVDTSDEGEYTCKASTAAGSAMCTASLCLQPEGMAVGAPTFGSPLKPVIATKGAEARFEIQILGGADLTITWLRNGEELTASNRIKISQEGNLYFLIISSVDTSDEGEYTCKASTAAGSARCTAPLLLQPEGMAAGGAPSFDSQLMPVMATKGAEARFEIQISGGADLTIIWLRNGEALTASDRIKISQEGNLYILIISSVDTSDEGEYTCKASTAAGSAMCTAPLLLQPEGMAAGGAPSFDSQLMPVIATKGAEARFEIQISGGADLTIIWLRNGEELTASDRIKISQEGNLYILIISSVDTSDEGEYTCKASTAAGSAMCSAPLLLKPEGMAAGGAPSFDSQLMPVIATKGAEARFEIQISGGADLTITWLRNGEVLTASDRIKISQKGNLYILIISSVDTSDEGEYTCKASTAAGSAMCTAPLLLKPSGGAGGGPSFSQPMKGLIVSKGASAKFECKVAADSEISISWSKDDKELTSTDRISISSEGEGVYVLAFSKVEQEDAGEYTCTAATAGGKAWCKAPLLVQKSGAASLGEESEDSSEDSSSEEETSSEEEE